MQLLCKIRTSGSMVLVLVGEEWAISSTPKQSPTPGESHKLIMGEGKINGTSLLMKYRRL